MPIFPMSGVVRLPLVNSTNTPFHSPDYRQSLFPFARRCNDMLPTHNLKGVKLLASVLDHSPRFIFRSLDDRRSSRPRPRARQPETNRRMQQIQLMLLLRVSEVALSQMSHYLLKLLIGAQPGDAPSVYNAFIFRNQEHKMPRGPLGMDTPGPGDEQPRNHLESGTTSKRHVTSPRQHEQVVTRNTTAAHIEFELDFPTTESIKCDAYSWISEPEVRINSVEQLDQMILGYVKFATFYQVQGQIYWVVEHESIEGSRVQMPYSIKFNMPIPITETYLRKAIRGWLNWLLKAGTLTKLVSNYVHLLRIKQYIVDNWPSICRNTYELEKLLDETKMRIRLELLPPMTDPSGGLIA